MNLLYKRCNAIARAVKYTTSSTRSLTSVTDKDGVRRIKLKNPEKRNALSFEMLKALKKNLTEIAERRSVRCVVLCADGPVFSSGHDLKELTTLDTPKFHEELFTLCADCMKLVLALPVPVIAEVRGSAFAAGFQLVSSCDIVVAADTARFALPGANVGLFCSTPAVAVSRALSPKVTSYLLFTGEPITATEAFQCGLVSKVVPEDQLQAATEEITRLICSKSRKVIELGKSFYYKQLEMDLHTAYRKGAKTMVDNLKLQDGKEGINAFLEKRPPSWSHM